MTQGSPQTNSSSSLLVQISDTHLCADPHHSLRGITTQECLDAVLNLASSHLQHATLIIATGDISHDGSTSSYRALEERLRNQSGSKRVLPGNHDQPEALSQVMSQPPWPTVDQLGSWRLIGLTSHLPGKEAGYLDSGQLAGLESALAANDRQPMLVALHHPPIPTGSHWMDKISLINQAEFRHLLSKYSQVHAVIFGHAHQEIDETRDGIRWLCCPSTCFQFLPHTEIAYSDARLPGYRWLRLHHDGRLETGVERLAEWPPGNGPDRRKSVR